VLFTPLFGATYRAALRAMGRSEDYTYIRWGERGLLLAVYALAWLGFGAGFYLFLSAVAELPAGSFWPVVGIGVRRGVYAPLLSLYLPGSVAVAVAVLSRVWLTAVGDGLGLSAPSQRPERPACTGGPRCARRLGERPEFLTTPEAGTGGHAGQR